MKRLISIDTFRGLSLFIMILYHVIAFWTILVFENMIFNYWVFNITDSIGSCAFLFLSGMSSCISYNKRKEMAFNSYEYSMKTVRDEFYGRALIILGMSCAMNFPMAIILQEPQWLFCWTFLQTLSISLILIWALFKTSKSFRIFLAIIIWILNTILFTLLEPYENQQGAYQILFILFYTTSQFDSPLHFFAFVIIGTIVGEIIYDAFKIEDKQEQKEYIKKKLLIPSILIGTCLIVIAIPINYPDFIIAASRTNSWRVFALGFDIILISVLIYFEVFEVFKFKKSYRFLFYFSYYSFTVYVSHYLLIFIFYHQLNSDIVFWVLFAITYVLYGLLLRFLYKKVGTKASLKFQINRLSIYTVKVLKERKNK